MAVDGSPRLGKNKKLYIDVDGDIATPTWVLADKIQGLNKNRSHALAEIEERGEDEVLVLPGHTTSEITFQLTSRPGNSIYDALEDAFEAKTKVGAAVMSGLIANSGERGLQGEFYVTQFDDDQGNTSTAVAVTLRLAADYDTAPALVEIA